MKTAVVIAAHNEQRTIAKTLASVGAEHDIFVASDNSIDRTAEIARMFTRYVLQVQRGGKGQALRILIDHYNLLDRYDAFVMLDADSVMAPGAVAAFEETLVPGVAGAVGNVRARSGGALAHWRAVQHTGTRLFYREGMAAINCIYIMSGTSSIWRTNAFRQIPMRDSPVEDMLYTYEIHRRKLGRIAFAQGAIVYTAEPTTLRDYTSQMLRWLRGYWGITAEFKTPFGRQALDMGQLVIIAQFVTSTLRLAALPFFPWLGVWGQVIVMSFALDFGIITTLAIIAAVRDRNLGQLGYLWFYPLMSLYDQMLNFYCFMTHRKLTSGVWVSPTRKDEICTVMASASSRSFFS